MSYERVITAASSNKSLNKRAIFYASKRLSNDGVKNERDKFIKKLNIITLAIFGAFIAILYIATFGLNKIEKEFFDQPINYITYLLLIIGSGYFSTILVKRSFTWRLLEKAINNKNGMLDLIEKNKGMELVGEWLIQIERDKRDIHNFDVEIIKSIISFTDNSEYFSKSHN